LARSQDDGVRGKRGLCISVRPIDGHLELTVDTVTLDDPVSRLWRHDTFITFVEVTAVQAKRFEFSEQQLAGFGRTMLGALFPAAV